MCVVYDYLICMFYLENNEIKISVLMLQFNLIKLRMLGFKILLFLGMNFYLIINCYDFININNLREKV